MAHQNPDGIYSLPAAADLSASQFQGVVVNTSGQFALAGIGVLPHGILDNAPVALAQARAYMAGPVLKMKVGVGGVSRGVPCCVDATGKLVAGATGHKLVFVPFEAGVAGQIVTGLWVPSGLGAVP